MSVAHPNILILCADHFRAGNAGNAFRPCVLYCADVHSDAQVWGPVEKTYWLPDFYNPILPCHQNCSTLDNHGIDIVLHRSNRPIRDNSPGPWTGRCRAQDTPPGAG